MASVTTLVPAGPIKEWCIAEYEWGYGHGYPGTRYECANATRGTQPTDFETICCNGNIIAGSVDIYSWSPSKGPIYLNLSDLLCCGISGPQQGGILPIIHLGTTCTQGTATPLISLAATNTNNVQPYLVTYTSASYGETTTGDFVPTETPYCLYAYTGSGVESFHVDLTQVTVPAATISTLPPETDQFDNYHTTYTHSTLDSSDSITRTTSSPTGKTTGTSGARPSIHSQFDWKNLVFGLMTVGLLLA
jgi:hypothetical protein